MQFKSGPPAEEPGPPMETADWKKLGDLCFGHLEETMAEGSQEWKKQKAKWARKRAAEDEKEEQQQQQKKKKKKKEKKADSG